MSRDPSEYGGESVGLPGDIMNPGPQPTAPADVPDYNDPSKQGEQIPDMNPGTAPTWEDQTPELDDPSKLGSG